MLYSLAMTPSTLASLVASMAVVTGCGAVSDPGTGGPSDAGVVSRPVEVVMFTHIEDSTPAGTLGSAQCQIAYQAIRGRLVEVAERARAHGLQWVVQPDWKILEAALLHEDASLTATTAGKNVFAYLHEDLGVTIDPHSHENGGYNYADVAYLLGELGVGGSTVIGGHIWDPALPQFQQWDRFRAPVGGLKYPTASWGGNILIGAGTPNHVNDPLISGAWRPLDRDHYFDHDPAGNIIAFGAWVDEVAGVEELVARRGDGTVSDAVMLTAAWNIGPRQFSSATGPDEVDAAVFSPIAALRDQGLIDVTDFTKLAALWQSSYGGIAGTYTR